MKYRLIFHPKAKQEYITSFGWYGLKLKGLEERFRLAVDELLEKLSLNPEYYSYSKEPFREAALRKFPFTIVFIINKEDMHVFIAAIYHSKRNPNHKFRKE